MNPTQVDKVIAAALCLTAFVAWIAVFVGIWCIASIHFARAQDMPVVEQPDCSGDRCVQFGVRVTPSDIAIKTMYGLCMLHLPLMDSKTGKITDNADWWPNPCNEVQAKFRDSGAQAKYEEIEKRDKANQLEMVKRGLGK